MKVRNTFSDWQEVRRGVPQGSVLGPMFLNFFFFRNDIFIQIKTVQLNMYADDGQLHTSDTEPVSLKGRISREVNSVNAWYEISGIIYIANPSKHQEMILGNTEHHFDFSVNDSMHLFDVTINNYLSFMQHVSFICKKGNNQLSVVIRFGYLMRHLYFPTSTIALCCGPFKKAYSSISFERLYL